MRYVLRWLNTIWDAQMHKYLIELIKSQIQQQPLDQLDGWIQFTLVSEVLNMQTSLFPSYLHNRDKKGKINHLNTSTPSCYILNERLHSIHNNTLPSMGCTGKCSLQTLDSSTVGLTHKWGIIWVWYCCFSHIEHKNVDLDGKSYSSIPAESLVTWLDNNRH